MTTHWRLVVEPIGNGLAWSLMSDDGSGTHLVDAQFDADTTALRRTAIRSLTAADADPWTAGLAQPATERILAVTLGRSLLPTRLRAALLALAEDEERPMVTIATRGWPALVAWPALALDDSGMPRLIARARVVAEAPPALLSGRARVADPGPGPCLSVIDPGPVTGEPSQLYPGGYPPTLLTAFQAHDLIGPGGVGASPQECAELLASQGWGRFIFAGHVRAGSEQAPALAALAFASESRVRWLSAREWIANPGRWPMPERVALIGCASSDEAPREQSGLTLAAINAGARLVVTTRWPLPVRHNADGVDGDVLTPLIMAVHEALASPQPLETLRRWQAVQATQWAQTRDPAASPLLWGALTVTVAMSGPVESGPAPTRAPAPSQTRATPSAGLSPLDGQALVGRRLADLEAAHDVLDRASVERDLASVGELVQQYGDDAMRRRYAGILTAATAEGQDPTLGPRALAGHLDDAPEDVRRTLDLILRGPAAVGRLIRQDAHTDTSSPRALAAEFDEFLATDPAIPPATVEALLSIRAALARGLGEDSTAFTDRAQALAAQRQSATDVPPQLMTYLDTLQRLFALRADRPEEAGDLVDGLPSMMRGVLPMDLLTTKVRQLTGDLRPAADSALAAVVAEMTRTRVFGSSRERSYAARGVVLEEAAATALDIAAELGDTQRIALLVELLRAQGMPALPDPAGTPSLSKVVDALTRDQVGPAGGEVAEALDAAETLLSDPPPMVMPWGEPVPGSDPADLRPPVQIQVLRPHP